MQTALEVLKGLIESDIKYFNDRVKDNPENADLYEFVQQRIISYGMCLKLIKDLYPKEREDIEQAYGDGLNPHRYPNCNRNEYFDKVFPTHNK